MPTTMTLKVTPDDVNEQLKRFAAAHRRSLNSEAIACPKKIFSPLPRGRRRHSNTWRRPAPYGGTQARRTHAGGHRAIQACEAILIRCSCAIEELRFALGMGANLHPAQTLSHASLPTRARGAPTRNHIGGEAQ